VSNEQFRWQRLRFVCGQHVVAPKQNEVVIAQLDLRACEVPEPHAVTLLRVGVYFYMQCRCKGSVSVSVSVSVLSGKSTSSS